MMSKVLFYLKYALRSMRRDRQRTLFAVFCVAIGVAAVVGLQSLGFIITDAMTGNAQAGNRGDLAVMLPGDQPFVAEQLDLFRGYVRDGAAVDATFLYHTQDIQVSVVREAAADRALVVDAFLVEPAKYPLYGTVAALDPPGRSLAELLQAPTDVVIGKSLADKQNLTVGSQLRLGVAAPLFTVRGIAPTSSVGDDKSNLTPALIGFVFLDYDSARQLFNLLPTASRIYLRTTGPDQTAALAAQIKAAVPAAITRTAADLVAGNRQLAEGVRLLMVVVGLLALLIGGIGIVNTILVVVSRRTAEIAVLKTLGLKGRQVTTLFLVEAALLGLVGSVGGILLGLALSAALVGFAGGFLMQDLPWRVYPQPVIFGIIEGLLVTVGFGLLPTLAAAQTRPFVVLRPSEGALPRSGRFASLAVVLAVTASLGLLAGALMQNMAGGVGLAFVTLIILALLLVVMRGVVGLLARLPSLGRVQLKLAWRGIGRNRSRAASTLLALIVGIFAISLITILASSAFGYLRHQTAQLMGANLLLISPSADTAAQEKARQVLASLNGVQSYAEAASIQTELVAINGVRDAGAGRIAQYEAAAGEPLTPAARQKVTAAFASITARDLHTNLPRYEFGDAQSRNLIANDEGQQVAVLQMHDYLRPLGLKTGDVLTLKTSAGELDLELIGVTTEGAASLGSPLVTSLQTVREIEPSGYSFYVDVAEAELDLTVTDLTRALPGAIVLETNYINNLLNSMLEQFATFPLLVAILTLFSGAVIIANSVALSTMERRREIGVMKALGAKGGRVLSQLLLENGLIGLVGGLLGLLPAALGALLLSALSGGGSLGSAISLGGANLGVMALLVVLAVAVTQAATLVSALSAARERPLNVLHYE